MKTSPADFVTMLNESVRATLVSAPLLDGHGRNVFGYVVREGGFKVERLNMSCIAIDILMGLKIGAVIQISTYPIQPALMGVTVIEQPTVESIARAEALASAVDI